MARSTEDVKRDIRETRDELGNTLEAIGDRVAPKKVVGRVKSNVSGRVDDVKERVNPLRLVRRGTDGVRNTLRSARSSGGAGDTESNGYELGPGSARTSSSARRHVKELTSRAGDTAGSVASSAGDAAQSAAERTKSAPRSLRRRAEDNPLLAGAAVFGGGFLLASRLAPTERERRLAESAKDRLEPVKQRALETSRGMAEELRSVAQGGVDEVRQRAIGAATQVKEEAASLAERVKEDARSSAEQVKEEAALAGEDVQGEARVATRRVKAKAEDATTAASSKPRVRRSPAAGGGPATAAATTRRTRAGVR